MLMPNTSCQVRRKGRSRDLYGKPSYSVAEWVECSVVKVEMSDQSGQMRLDTSAANRNAKETMASCTLLFRPSESPARQDLIEFAGMTFEVALVHPRLTASGELHHHEVRGVAWLS